VKSVTEIAAPLCPRFHFSGSQKINPVVQRSRGAVRDRARGTADVSERFRLDDFPIPSILVDCSPLQADLDLTLVAPNELARLMQSMRGLEANISALELFGASVLAEVRTARCMRDEFLAWFGASLPALLSQQHTDWSETAIYTVAGVCVPVLGRARVFRDPDGRPERMLWSVIDITATKAAEAAALAARTAAEEANRSKSEFLATVSHEIRTPLNGVLGMTQLLQRATLTAEQAQMVATISQSGQSLLTLLNDLLDLAKIEANRLELEEIPFAPAEVAEAAVGIFRGLATQKDLVLSLSVEPGAERRRLGDPTRIRQVISNLVSNALKFTAQGGVEVEIGTCGSDLRIAVRDTGEGISPEVQQRLFQSFSQADASTARRHGGTGLGLSICLRLAQAMGGSIALESEMGRGSTFTFLAPLLEAADRTESHEDDADAATVDLTQLRVLVAEDNPVNQLVLRTMLTSLGVNAELVGNGREAVAAWTQGAYDLVLMDVRMPEMDGLQALAEIRRLEHHTARPRTPIFALTADVMAHQVAEHLAAGMDGSVEKPLRIERLIEVLAATASRLPAVDAAPLSVSGQRA
jgi:signal transduction histidine kinase/CheY-like chemotaxis protein